MGFTREKTDEYGNHQVAAYTNVGRVICDYARKVLTVELHEYADQEARRKGLRYIDTNVVVEGDEFDAVIDEKELAKPEVTLRKVAYVLAKQKYDGQVLTDVLEVEVEKPEKKERKK